MRTPRWSTGYWPRRATASVGHNTGSIWCATAKPRASKKTALRPDAHRYRDYVIQAFNNDLPYDRFVRQQLAGDELEPQNPDALIATGLVRLYPEDINASNMVSAAAGDSGRHHRKHRPCIPGPDDRLCPLPRSQIRRHQAGRLLPLAGLLRRDFAQRRCLDRFEKTGRRIRQENGDLGNERPSRFATLIDSELADERQAAREDAIAAYDPQTKAPSKRRPKNAPACKNNWSAKRKNGSNRARACLQAAAHPTNENSMTSRWKTWRNSTT